MSKQLTLLISETLIRDEFGSSCCSTNSLQPRAIGLGECPVCHMLWRKFHPDGLGWNRDAYWYCPEDIANGCAFPGTASCKTCRNANVKKYPSDYRINGESLVFQVPTIGCNTP
jgi:hypothetical protein